MAIAHTDISQAKQHCSICKVFLTLDNSWPSKKHKHRFVPWCKKCNKIKSWSALQDKKDAPKLRAEMTKLNSLLNRYKAVMNKRGYSYVLTDDD